MSLILSMFQHRYFNQLTKGTILCSLYLSTLIPNLHFGQQNTSLLDNGGMRGIKYTVPHSLHLRYSQCVEHLQFSQEIKSLEYPSFFLNIFVPYTKSILSFLSGISYFILLRPVKTIYLYPRLPSGPMPNMPMVPNHPKKIPDKEPTPKILKKCV